MAKSLIIYTVWNGEREEAFPRKAAAISRAKELSKGANFTVEVERCEVVPITRESFCGMFDYGGCPSNWCRSNEVVFSKDGEA